MKITAAVARERMGDFTIEQLELSAPRPDELLVEVVASGMCQTDLHGRDGYYNTPLPAVFGHEGAGIVAAVGTNVTRFVPGDHVIMSFPWCGTCANCRRDMPSGGRRRSNIGGAPRGFRGRPGSVRGTGVSGSG